MSVFVKAKWVVWIQHLGSRTWHDVTRSEYFDVVHKELCKYVRDNHTTVKFYILVSPWSPDTLPSDFPEPTEMRG